MSGRPGIRKIQAPVILLGLILALTFGCGECHDPKKTGRLDKIQAASFQEQDLNFILACLNDSDPFIRYRAAAIMAARPHKEALDILLNSLNRDSDLRVRMYAAVALGKLRDAKALGPLIKALKDPAFNVRYKAAAALGTLGDPAAIPYLKEAAHSDPHNYVRLHAELALRDLNARLQRANNAGK